MEGEREGGGSNGEENRGSKAQEECEIFRELIICKRHYRGKNHQIIEIIMRSDFVSTMQQIIEAPDA